VTGADTILSSGKDGALILQSTQATEFNRPHEFGVKEAKPICGSARRRLRILQDFAGSLQRKVFDLVDSGGCIVILNQ
jgi:hypothetical protein